MLSYFFGTPAHVKIMNELKSYCGIDWTHIEAVWEINQTQFARLQARTPEDPVSAEEAEELASIFLDSTDRSMDRLLAEKARQIANIFADRLLYYYSSDKEDAVFYFKSSMTDCISLFGRIVPEEELRNVQLTPTMAIDLLLITPESVIRTHLRELSPEVTPEAVEEALSIKTKEQFLSSDLLAKILKLNDSSIIMKVVALVPEDSMDEVIVRVHRVLKCIYRLMFLFAMPVKHNGEVRYYGSCIIDFEPIRELLDVENSKMFTE